MILKYRETTRLDVETIQLRPIFSAELQAREPFLSNAIYRHSPMVTVLIDGVPAVIVKGSIIWDGVMLLGALTSEEVLKNPFGLTRVMRRILHDTARLYRVHRFQLTVRANELKAQKFVEHFGFVREGVLMHYGPDKQNYIMYGRVF